MGNLEAEAMPLTLYYVPQTIPEQFFAVWQGALALAMNIIAIS